MLRTPVAFCGGILLLVIVAATPVQADNLLRRKPDLSYDVMGKWEEPTAEKLEKAWQKMMEEARKKAEPEEARRGVIRSAQAELRRHGCYSGAENGDLDDATRDALKWAYAARGPAGVPLEIDEAVLSNLKTLKGPICKWSWSE